MAAVILLGKTAVAVLLVLALRHPLSTALTVGASLDIPHWSDKLGFRAAVDALVG